MAESCVCRGMVDDCPLCGGMGRESCVQCHGVRKVALRKAEGCWESVACGLCAHVLRPAKDRVVGMLPGMSAWTFGRMLRQYPVLNRAGERARAMLAVGQGWMVMYGPWGVGKSYCMAAILNELLGMRERTGRYVLMSAMMQEFQDAQTGRHPDGKIYSALMRELVDVDVLCLDEFGEWNPSEFREKALRQLLVARSDPMWRVTLLATNRTGNDLQKSFPWLTSRFNSPLVVELDFSSIPDLRK